ncbi:MAG: hypothetical protein OXK72_09480 [Gammaproteobacteria bacterium]|nr:hypothetical protein [Gammaproteobacteria bacterium]
MSLSRVVSKIFQPMPTSINALVNDAFDQAIRQDQKLYESWIDISTQLGGRALPFSLLGPSVHDIGTLDLVLRCMESETKAVFNLDSASRNEYEDQFHLAHWCQDMFSKIWISEIYEVFRLLKTRKLIQGNSAFYELENHLRLLRIPFDKHEIAKEDRLKDKPLLKKDLEFKHGTSPLNRYSEYDSKDRRRVYSLESRNSPRGSIEWRTLDLETGNPVWLERLSLSDRVLEIFQNNQFFK